MASNWLNRFRFIFACIVITTDLEDYSQTKTLFNYKASFFVVYLIESLLIGFPLTLLSISIGQHFQSSLTTSIGKHSKRYVGFGLLSLFTTFIYLGYLLANTIYHLKFFMKLTTNKSNLFDFSKVNVDLRNGPKYLIDLEFFYCLFCILLLVSVVITKYRKRLKIIFTMMYIILFICHIALIIKLYQIAPAKDIIKEYLFTMDPTHLTNAELWILTLESILLSYKFGLGVLISYSGSLSKYQNTVLDSFIIVFFKFTIQLIMGIFSSILISLYKSSTMHKSNHTLEI